ncbi:dienelactone hydrolase family protein [Alcanivorax marinus]|uniref:Dienelactone hydrolase family protein n=1 Tax=Alloalcanivorax marinus TaxID=1177169 RepID=A0A9Q3UHK4_9GAMM|nr:dienelactone hydrolase family protein [Alloalcanivorax marinus]MCC4307311.1 dienelactone hydrolase family protein [Alloalcanivorax marinus]MCH2558208.1 dienelactone hydrolase family protein [Alcanivorax sp.]
MSDIVNQAIDYEVDGRTFQGHLLYLRGASPSRALLMAPNFFGISDAAIAQAERQLDNTRAIFVLDPFGKDVRPQTPDQAMEAMGAARADNAALRARLRGALAVLEREAGELGIARDRLAMLGFCFGGACALELARDGADLRAFVSFHGLLDTPAPAAGPVKGSVLVLNGADDPMVSEDSLKAFKKEMDGAGADWQLTHFGGAVHSFTDPGANMPGRSVYDPKVSRRAFAAMDDLFDEVFSA